MEEHAGLTTKVMIVMKDLKSHLIINNTIVMPPL